MDLIEADPAPDLPLPLQAHPSYARALTLLGRSATALCLTDAGSRLAHLVLIRRRIAGLSLSLATRGPVFAPGLPPDRALLALRRLRAAGLGLIEAEGPDQALRRAGFRQTVTAAHVAEIDLTCPPEARIATMAPKWRNVWRRAGRAGLTVEAAPFDPASHGWLLLAEAAQRRARGYRGLPADFVVAFAQANPGGAVVFAASLDAAPVAAMLMLCHGTVATYHLGWSGPAGRAAAAHHLLLVAAADLLATRGHVRLDLGAVDTEANPGLARFKIGAGATVRPLGGSWIAIPGL
jgi:hypothetical protein